jgi:hypothetical protein
LNHKKPHVLHRQIHILPNHAAPVRVLKAHEGPGKTKYSVDVRVLKVGTLEDSEQVTKDNHGPKLESS